MESLNLNLDDLIKSNENSHTLNSDLHPCSLCLRISNFSDSKEYHKFIKSVEKMVRSSSEYREWKSYIIQVMEVNKCVVTNESIDDCEIEIHHHIPSLYVLVKAVINKYLDEAKSFCTFDICTDIIELHFQNRIGFVPLIKSLHEKYHNDKLDIPSSLILGNYKWLMQNYRFDTEDLDLLHTKLNVLELSGCNWQRNNYPGLVKEQTKDVIPV